MCIAFQGQPGIAKCSFPRGDKQIIFEQLKLREIAKNNREGRQRERENIENREKGAKQLKLFVFALN